ncbi:FecR family protein [Longitalea arenae]|uniref:FecR family protein n=1 Tax=Longitalea arenae TaxID=2812558 RepID=UPI0019682C78|nr:FecR family protein [Longitalea arenae]
MPETNEYLSQLLTHYINSTCTPKQVEELMQLLQHDTANRALLQQLQVAFDKAMEGKAELPAAISDRLRNRLLQQVQAPVTPLYQRFYFRVAVAAVFILSLGAAWFLFLKTAPVQEVARHKEAPPAKMRVTKKAGAYITLANGEIIELGNADQGPLAGKDSIHVLKLADSRIAYDTASHKDAAVTYHTLTVPRGTRRMQVMLADGSMVWLNTASSLKYPTSFAGNQRAVELNGEAYFDVKHDAARPFTVHTKDLGVQVLGTGFNVSAYDDDEGTNVVLVQGSVAVHGQSLSGNLTKRLLPGNMASFRSGAERIATSSVDIEEYISWRKGYLIFRQTPLAQIAKRMSRYYDVRINTDVLLHSDETFSGRLDLQHNIEAIMNLVCLGTPYYYLPKEQKLALRK